MKEVKRDREKQCFHLILLFIVVVVSGWWIVHLSYQPVTGAVLSRCSGCCGTIECVS